MPKQITVKDLSVLQEKREKIQGSMIDGEVHYQDLFHPIVCNCLELQNKKEKKKEGAKCTKDHATLDRLIDVMETQIDLLCVEEEDIGIKARQMQEGLGKVVYMRNTGY